MPRISYQTLKELLEFNPNDMAVLLPHIETTIQVDTEGNASVIKIPDKRVMVLLDLPYEVMKDYL